MDSDSTEKIFEVKDQKIDRLISVIAQKDREIAELLSFIKKVAHSNPSETTLKYINEGCDLLIKHQKE